MRSFETPEDYQVWARDYEHRLTAVALFGTQTAWKQAKELDAVIHEAMGAAPRYEGDIEERFIEAWERVIEAMRPDTAPAEETG